MKEGAEAQRKFILRLQPVLFYVSLTQQKGRIRSTKHCLVSFAGNRTKIGTAPFAGFLFAFSIGSHSLICVGFIIAFIDIFLP